MAHPTKGVPLICLRDQIAGINNNLDGPRRHDVKREKPFSKVDLLYDSIYMTFPKKQSNSEGEEIGVGVTVV